MNNCAWCKEPPDKNGSHSICKVHAVLIIEQRKERARRKLKVAAQAK